MQRICVFDVNETLLDLSAMEPLFERHFGNPALRREWFTQMLQSGFVATITGAYTPFGAIGLSALRMLEARYAVELSDEDRQQIADAMRALPPHPEVPAALERLRSAGFRLAALTNSTAEVVEAQLAHAGIRAYFEQALSADTVQRLKPAPEVYHMAAQALGVEIGGMRLIAAHAWDVAGALRSGCAAAFVARPGAIFDPLVAPPDVVGADLHEVAERIVELEAVAQ